MLLPRKEDASEEERHEEKPLRFRRHSASIRAFGVLFIVHPLADAKHLLTKSSVPTFTAPDLDEPAGPEGCHGNARLTPPAAWKIVPQSEVAP